MSDVPSSSANISTPTVAQKKEIVRADIESSRVHYEELKLQKGDNELIELTESICKSNTSQSRFCRTLCSQPSQDKFSIKVIPAKFSSDGANANYTRGCTIGKIFLTKVDGKTLLLKGKLWCEVLKGNNVNVFEVVGEGTKFMKSFNCPTVIVKFLTGSLDASTVYYVILEPKVGEYSWKVPALMFSNPYAHNKTKYAELLPMCFLKSCGSVCASPMLLKKRWAWVFRRGFSFVGNALVNGRSLNGQRQHSWNKYDIRSSALRELTKGLIELDIYKMIVYLKNLTAVLKPGTNRQKYLRKKGRLNHESSTSPGNLKVGKSETHKDNVSNNVSSLSTDKGTTVGSTEGQFFVKCSKAVYPKNISQKKHNAAFPKDLYIHFTDVDKDCCTSEII